MSIYYFLKRRALTIRRKKDSQQRYKLLERRDIVIKRISESLLPSWSKNYPVFGQVGATETSPERRFLLLLSALIETLETTLRLIARYTHAPPKDNRWKKKKKKRKRYSSEDSTKRFDGVLDSKNWSISTDRGFFHPRFRINDSIEIRELEDSSIVTDDRCLQIRLLDD